MVTRKARPRLASHRDSSIASSLRAWAHREKSHRSHIPDDGPILTIFPSTQTSERAPDKLGWFHWWLDRQIASLPRSFAAVLPNDLQAPETARPHFGKAFVEVARIIKAQEEPCIDCIVDDLVSAKLFKENLDNDEILICRTLVFAMLGWQTMLYQPSFGTSPLEQFAVIDDFDGYQGQAFLAFKQDSKNSRRRLDEFLMGFGLLIPPRNTCFSEDPEEKTAFDCISTVDPAEFNAYVLSAIAHINIRWVDALSVHLEYNKATNTLYLFRYPSFCAASQPHTAKENTDYSVIHCCACPLSCRESQVWASTDDITDFLHEVLLSYRLLFGQNKQARQYFRHSCESEAFADIPPEGHDSLLSLLCDRKSIDLDFDERETYRLARHFPMLRFRIAVLKKQLAVSKPRGWRELWRDKRDSAQWVTFWAVIIIGGIGVFLSLCQVVLGVLQVAWRQ